MNVAGGVTPLVVRYRIEFANSKTGGRGVRSPAVGLAAAGYVVARGLVTITVAGTTVVLVGVPL